METAKLVSVIIPCFNAERWIAEAITSCLSQTYPEIEVIVVDDGSSDRSLEVIKSFSHKITWTATGKNLGGNHARNLGFTLAKGQYIQYLDADDFLKSNKIAKQVTHLEQFQGDIIYCDVAYQHHPANGSPYREEAKFLGIAGRTADFLYSLLAYGCLPPMAYLLRREVVLNSSGWDENLRAGQDRDFLLNLAIHQNLKVLYRPGFDCFYRRYGNVTVSTANKPRLVSSFCRVLDKAEGELLQMQRLNYKYLYALYRAYQKMSQDYREDITPELYQALLTRAKQLQAQLRDVVKCRDVDTFKDYLPCGNACVF